MPSVLTLCFSFVNSLLMSMHQVRRTYVTPTQHKTRILYFVGYAPGDTAIYDVFLTQVVLPAYLLMFTSLSHFVIHNMNYVARLTDSMVREDTLPMPAAQTSGIDIMIYTYIHLLSHRDQSKEFLPSMIMDTLHEDLEAFNTICRDEDDKHTTYAALTYSLGSYVYEHCFPLLDTPIQEQMVYEGYVGQATLAATFLDWPSLRPKRIFRHLIGSQYDIFRNHQEQYPAPLVDNLEITDLWHYYPISKISRLLVHLIMWVDPIGLYAIVSHLQAQVQLYALNN